MNRRWNLNGRAGGIFCCLIWAAILSCGNCARAEHGQFDRTTPDPRDEALIFTPAGFERPGQPAEATGVDVARLNVTVTDRATGKPTPARVNVVGSDGNFYQPRDNPLRPFSLTGTWPETLAGNRPGKAPIRYFGHFFYTPGTFSVDVPAGAVRVEIWKGFEYRVEMVSTHVVAGDKRDMQITLAPAVDMAAEGWHSADPHLHFVRANDADDNTIFDLLDAEDIRLGMVLCYNDNTSDYPGLMPELATPQLRGLGAKSVRRRGACQIISGQEYRNEVLGHINLFLRDRLVLDGTRVNPNIGPLFGAIGEETRQQGGYAFHAHGGYGLEIWADLVAGATSGVELLQFGIYRGIGLEGWYHVLGAGFRFPGVAACDYPACRKLGDCRTYVYVAGEPSFENWMKAAAEGRSFMTSGPLVFLDVDGHRPGDTIATSDGQPRRVRAKVRVRSETAPVTNVQLVASGNVVRELIVPRAAGTGQWLELDESIELTESGWIAARAFSRAPSGAADAEAHTNPVYVHLAGRPPYRAADAVWLIKRLDEQIADHEARKVPERAAAVAYFRQAREKLQDMQRRHAEEDAVREALVRPLLPAGTALAEVRKFAVPRIPASPQAATRQEWEAQAAKLRSELLDKVVLRGGAQAWRTAQTKVEWLDTISGGPDYQIRKLRYEALPGMWIPALLYEPRELAGRVPLVVHFNGHEREGKAVAYKQLLSINLARRGMLVLDPEWFGMGQLAMPGFSHYRMNQLDLCGASGLAPFYLAMSRALDLGLELEHADPQRVAVAGLSGGGWQTIVLAGLDPRVTLANPVAGYGGLRSNILNDDMGDSEQAPTDLGAVGDYTHLTALRAPRPTLLTYNASDDCCFQSGHALAPLADAARPLFALWDAEDRLRTHVNHVPGTHNFDQENRAQFYAFLGDYFYPGDGNFRRTEIPSAEFVKKADELLVPLPADNLDFHRLAVKQAAALPRDPRTPSDSKNLAAWRQTRRDQLAKLLKIRQYEVTGAQESSAEQAGCRIVRRLLACGQDWTIPCVELTPATVAGDEARRPMPPSRQTVVVVADGGKADTTHEVLQQLTCGHRVLAVDLFALGESQVAAQDPSFLYPLFLSSLGERPLGMQAAQLTAIARWARQDRSDLPLTVVATGPRASMAALVAVAMEPAAIDGVEVSGNLTSLRQLIEQDRTVEELPELFAFGLLAEFDVDQIVALAAPRAIKFRDRSETLQKDSAPSR